MKTSDKNQYMLLTTFIQLDGRTYWLFLQISLKLFLLNVRTLFTHLWLIGFYSPLAFILIAHAHVLTGCTCDNPVRVVPAQKCNGKSTNRDLK